MYFFLFWFTKKEWNSSVLQWLDTISNETGQRKTSVSASHSLSGCFVPTKTKSQMWNNHTWTSVDFIFSQSEPGLISASSADWFDYYGLIVVYSWTIMAKVFVFLFILLFYLHIFHVAWKFATLIYSINSKWARSIPMFYLKWEFKAALFKIG